MGTMASSNTMYRTVWQRRIRIGVLTILFSIYVVIWYACLHVRFGPEQDRLMQGGLFVSCVYFWLYWRFWKADVKRFGKPDILVRIVCYVYSPFFCVGTMLALLQLNTWVDGL
jgi:hypothetical protein